MLELGSMRREVHAGHPLRHGAEAARVERSSLRVTGGGRRNSDEGMVHLISTAGGATHFSKIGTCAQLSRRRLCRCPANSERFIDVGIGFKEIHSAQLLHLFRHLDTVEEGAADPTWGPSDLPPA